MPEREQYLLSSHVHLCIVGESTVLLDLRQDRYFAVGPSQSEALAHRVLGWPPPSAGRSEYGTANASSFGADGARSLLNNMLAMGVLTTDRSQGREATPTRFQHPEQTLVRPDLEVRPIVQFGFFVRLMRAVIVARWDLRRHSIESVVTRIQQRRAQRCGDGPFDLERAQEIVALFVYLRPLFFAARNACLFDCRVLIELMSYYGLFPSWVFGVKTKPFGAHCWIQVADVVFNDTPENVRAYQPILPV